MSVKQISVFIENRPGSVVEVTGILADNGVDMRAISLTETTDFGIARIIVNDVFTATTALKEAGFVCSLSEALAVAIPDKPGGLHQAVKVLADAEINVEYVYAFLGSHKGEAYMIFMVNDPQKAEAVLTSHNMRLVDQEELAEL